MMIPEIIHTHKKEMVSKSLNNFYEVVNFFDTKIFKYNAVLIIGLFPDPKNYIK